MAQGSQTLTTYYAKRIIGDAAASGAAAALLQTGSGVTASTWILNRTNRETSPYGIYYYYDNTTSGTADKIQFIGGSTSSVRAEIELDNGNTDIKGTLNADGATTLGSTLDVVGNTTLSGTLNTYGATTLSSTLNVIGSTTLSGDLDTYGNTTLSGTLNVYAATTLSNTLAIGGNTTFGGHLYLTGTKSAGASNTTQIVFTDSTTSTEYVALTANTAGAFVINPSTSTTSGAIVLKPNGNSAFKSGTTLTINEAAQNDYTFKVSGTTNITGNTTIGGTLGVTGATTLSSTLDVIGATTLSSTLNVAGITTITSSTAASSTSTGALVVSGGVGIGEDLYIGGHLHIAPTKIIYGTRSDNDTNYEIINNYGNGNITFNALNGDLNLSYKYTPTTRIYYSSGTNRYNRLTVNSVGTTFEGSVILAIPASSNNVTKSHLYLTGTTSAGKDNTTQILFTNSNRSTEYVAITSYTGGSLLINQSSSTTTGQIGLTPNGKSYFYSTTSATSTSTGALVVSGGVGIGGALYVGGAGTFSSSLSADTITITNTSATPHLTFSRNGANYITIPDNSSAALYIGKGASSANSFVTISATKLEILNTTSATSTDTGALVVGGGAGIDGALYTGGAGSIGGTLTVKGTSISIQTGGSRYKHIYIKNSAGNTAGDIYYDSGNATNISSGRFAFYEYSPNATANTTNNGNYERYLLPTVKTNLADSVDYSIITTKNLTSITSVGTIASGTWNGTEIGTAYGGTGNTSFTASRLIYTSAATTLSTGSNLITDGTYLALNTTSIDGSHGLYIREGGKNAGRLHVVTSGATANTEGWLQFSLGNETKSSAANNWSGRLRLCNKNGAYSDIEGAYGSLGGSNKNYISMTYVKATNFYGDLVGKYMSVASGGVSSSAEATGSTSLANVQIRYGDASSVSHRTATTIYFNPAFSSGCYKVICFNNSNSFNATSTISVSGITKAKFVVYQSNSSSVGINIHWIAFGY